MRRLNELLYPEKGTQKHIFFSGKGGVGKTSLACMTAVETANQGYRTLLMTTDPAAHIGNVLERPVFDEVTAVEGVNHLYAIKIDPKKAAVDYKNKILEDAKKKFSANTVMGMEEELNSPCTEEMAAFQKFVDLTDTADFEVIVIDTAPTGHTLRLLELPMDWSKQLQLKAGVSAEVSDEDRAQKAKFDKVVAVMKDPVATTFAFVMYPEKTPIIEAFRASQELETFGITTQLVIANLVIPEEQATSPFFQNRRNMQIRYIDEIKRRFNNSILVEVPLYDKEIRGISMLNAIASQILR